MHICLVVFLKERMLQSCRYTIIDIHKTLMCVYYVQLTICIGGLSVGLVASCNGSNQ